MTPGGASITMLASAPGVCSSKPPAPGTSGENWMADAAPSTSSAGGKPYRPAGFSSAIPMEVYRNTRIGNRVHADEALRQQRHTHDHHRHHRNHDGADGVDFRFHAEPHIRIDLDRQGGGTRPGGEARDHEIVEREREG